MADLTFSTTLLGQFLEDMEAYAEVMSPSLSASYTYLEGAVTRSSQVPAVVSLTRPVSQVVSVSPVSCFQNWFALLDPSLGVRSDHLYLNDVC